MRPKGEGSMGGVGGPDDPAAVAKAARLAGGKPAAQRRYVMVALVFDVTEAPALPDDMKPETLLAHLNGRPHLMATVPFTGFGAAAVAGETAGQAVLMRHPKGWTGEAG